MAAPTTALSNYLNSLSPNDMPQYGSGENRTPQPPPVVINGKTVSTYGKPYQPPKSIDLFHLLHAPISAGSIEKLQPKGPRANADVGQPHEASVDFFEMGKFSVGSWWCGAGGWPSPRQRDSTEVFFVLSGRGCVTDVDGVPHEFGPGDTVTLPKGWSGRWDVLEDIHKIWFVHEHANIEESGYPIRAQVTPYEKLVSPQYLSPLVGGPGAASRLIYSLGPTTVGSVVCAPGSSSKACHYVECFHIVEGILFLSTTDGKSQRCVTGDTVLLPPGWNGHHDVVEKTTMLWLSVDQE